MWAFLLSDGRGREGTLLRPPLQAVTSPALSSARWQCAIALYFFLPVPARPHGLPPSCPAMDTRPPGSFPPARALPPSPLSFASCPSSLPRSPSPYLAMDTLPPSLAPSPQKITSLPPTLPLPPSHLRNALRPPSLPSFVSVHPRPSIRAHPLPLCQPSPPSRWPTLPDDALPLCPSSTVSFFSCISLFLTPPLFLPFSFRRLCSLFFLFLFPIPPLYLCPSLPPFFSSLLLSLLQTVYYDVAKSTREKFLSICIFSFSL